MKRILFISSILILTGLGCSSSSTYAPSPSSDTVNTSKIETQTATNYIEVKYRDTKVDIAHERFEYRNTSKSSWIKGAWYDSENEYLVINLRGTYYHHCGLNTSSWRGFKSASSYGSYYTSNIKGSFDCRTGYIPTYKK